MAAAPSQSPTITPTASFTRRQSGAASSFRADTAAIRTGVAEGPGDGRTRDHPPPRSRTRRARRLERPGSDLSAPGQRHGSVGREDDVSGSLYGVRERPVVVRAPRGPFGEYDVDPDRGRLALADAVQKLGVERARKRPRDV